MTLFEQGTFSLHSGRRSRWRINAEVLTDADLETLAMLMADLVGPYGSVEGVPRGGLRLAAILQQGVSDNVFHLIVDDVLTTGQSLKAARDAFLANGSNRPVIGAVLFARGPIPSWAFAVFAYRGEA
jgi:orotate phosphoribosyltransferase